MIQVIKVDPSGKIVFNDEYASGPLILDKRNKIQHYQVVTPKSITISLSSYTQIENIHGRYRQDLFKSLPLVPNDKLILRHSSSYDPYGIEVIALRVDYSLGFIPRGNSETRINLQILKFLSQDVEFIGKYSVSEILNRADVIWCGFKPADYNPEIKVPVVTISLKFKSLFNTRINLLDLDD